jgi:hypothetical protein
MRTINIEALKKKWVIKSSEDHYFWRVIDCTQVNDWLMLLEKHNNNRFKILEILATQIEDFYLIAKEVETNDPMLITFMKGLW